MTVWQKIKNWFAGENSKNSSYKTSKKSLSSSKKTATQINRTTNKSALEAQLKKQEAEKQRKKEQLLQAFKAKESKVTTKAKDSNYQQNGGADKVLKKIQQKATQDNASKTSKMAMASNQTKRMPEVKARDNELMKAKKEATGLSTKDVQFQQKLGLNPTLTATDITYGNAKAPIATAAITGVTNGALLGAPELLQKKASAPIQNALNDVQQNYTTGQKWAKGIGEVAGTFMPYGMSMGGASKLGKALVGNTADDAVRIMSSSKWMQNLAARTGKDAVDLATKVADSLVTDLGLHLTTENLQSIIMGLNKTAETGNSGDFLPEYIKQQAINTAFNLGLDLAPLAGQVVKAVGNTANAKLISQVGAVGDDISKATNNSKALIPEASAYGDNLLEGLYKATKKKEYYSTGFSEYDAGIEKYIKIAEENGDAELAKKLKDKYDEGIRKIGYEAIDESFNKSNKKSWKKMTFFIRNEDGVKEVSGSVKRIQGAKGVFGVYKDANGWRVCEASTGSVFDPVFKSKSLASQYIESEAKNFVLPDNYSYKYFGEMVGNSLHQKHIKISDAVASATENAKLDPRYIKAKELIQDDLDRLKQLGDEWKRLNDSHMSTYEVEREVKAISGNPSFAEAERKMNHVTYEYTEKAIKDAEKINDNATLQLKAKTKAEPPKTEEFAKVDDVIPSVKESDNIKADAEADLDKAIKKNTKQAPLSKSGKQVDKARMKAEKAKTGKAKKMGGENTSFGEAVKTEEIYKEKLTPDTRMGHGAVNATNNARQDLYRKTGQELAEAGGFEFDVWHDKDNYEKSFNRIADTVFTKKGKVDSKGIKLITDEFNNFANGTRNIAVGDESKRATFDAISMMNFCNAHYVDDSASKVLTKAEKELNKALNEAYAASVAQYTKLANASATTMRLGKQMAEANPAARAMAVKKCVMNMLNDSLGFVRKNGKLTDADYVKFINDNKEIKEAFLKLEELSKTANKEALDTAIGDVYKAVNKKVPLTLLDAVTEWRYICMLCSPKTHVRNFVGNGLFGAVRQVSDAMAASKELRLYNKGKIKYLTKGGIDPKITKEAHMTAEALAEKGSESAKIAKEAYDKAKPNMFKENQKYEMYRANGGGKAIEGMRKWGDFISSWLEKEDSWAIEWRYRENYQKFLKANKYGTEQQTIKDTKKLLALANEYSQNEALEATFRDYNEVAANLNKFMANMTKADAGVLKRGAAVAMNTMMPFVKTPMNVLKQSVVNYNPMFLFKAHNELKTAISKGDTEAINKAVEKIAKKQTGGIIVALGAMIGAIDSDLLNVRTNAGDDAGEKYKKRQGFQDYSISVGNKFSATLDWATPTASVFFTGVEFGKQMKEILSGEGIDFSSAMSIIGMTASRVLDPTLETSMLSGINSALDTLKKSQYDENASKMSAAALIAENMAGNYVSSLVPTILSQVSRTLAPNDYMVTGKNNVDYFGNLMLSKIPFVSNAVMPAKTDSWGRVSGDKGNGAERIGKTALALVGNTLSPANVKKINWGKTDDKLVKLYEKTGDEDVLPTISYDRSFEVGQNGKNGVKKTEVTLTPKQMSIYNQARATGGEDAMASVLENIMFNRPTTDSNGNKVLSKDAYDKDAKQKLINQYKGKSTKEVVEWLMNQPQYKKASEAEKKQVLSTLFDNSGEKAKGNRKTSERAVWKAQGKNVNEYDFKNELSAKKQSNLKGAISSGVVTYKEAVDFARNAGKTYYYENEDGGGSSQTYYNKKEMIAYLQSKGYSYEKAEALYNAFKNSNAKSYNGSGSSGSGYGYRRSGSGGSKKQLVHSLKTSAYNAKVYKPKSKNITKGVATNNDLETALQNMNKAREKVTPPKNKE